MFFLINNKWNFKKFVWLFEFNVSILTKHEQNIIQNSASYICAATQFAICNRKFILLVLICIWIFYYLSVNGKDDIYYCIPDFDFVERRSGAKAKQAITIIKSQDLFI